MTDTTGTIAPPEPRWGHQPDDVMDQANGISPALMVEKGKLLPVEQAREIFGSGDNLRQVPLHPEGGTSFRLEDMWWQNIDSLPNETPVPFFADVRLDGGTILELQFTKEAALQACSEVGISSAYATKTPGALIAPHLNYWYASPDRNAKVLESDGLVRGVTRATLTPFSNLRILDRAVETIRGVYGADAPVFVDRKSSHRMKGTNMLIIVPGAERSIREGDNWCGGVQIKNSLTGDAATAISGYLFRWWCTNGAITKHRSSGNYSRRGNAGHDDSVYDWAGRSTQQVLQDLDTSFNEVEVLANTPIQGEVNDTLNQIFERYRLPKPAQRAIRNNMLESGDLTMYGVMQAVTQAANSRTFRSDLREDLMSIGGDLAISGGRCESCHRVDVSPHFHGAGE